mgnify:FL=1
MKKTKIDLTLDDKRISAIGLNNRKTLILHLRHDLSIYYKNLPCKALFYFSYLKKQFVV